MPITASTLYSFVECPHRIWLDAVEDPNKRDPVSPFVELLWERGSKFERETMLKLGQPFLDLSAYPTAHKERETLEAMQRREPLIYGGRISHGDMVGEPDLLRCEAGGYVAGDIKSGSGEEATDTDDGKPKRHYAVQLALYTDILCNIGFSAGRRAFAWDIHGDEVPYDFEAPLGIRTPETLWQFYEKALATTRLILAGQEKTLPAAAAVCKLCHWYTNCRDVIRNSDDLTQIAELGRTKRDVMIDHIATASDLAEIDLIGFGKGKKTVFSKIGPDMLRKFQERARLLKAKDGRPYLTKPVRLPISERELHFDIEVDPLRDHIYLHGFVVREASGETRFMSFVAEQPTADDERGAFADAMAFFRASPNATVYVYSSYERTKYRGLQQRYPDVASVEEIEALFDESRTVDLYRIVKTSTEWPTWDHSIKTLAKFLGFTWRDTNPSGAASIEWYDRFVETGERALLQRILDYNEDDCRAMIVLLDGIRSMA